MLFFLGRALTTDIPGVQIKLLCHGQTFLSNPKREKNIKSSLKLH